MLVQALRDEGVERPVEQIFMLDQRGLIVDTRDDLRAHHLELAHPAASLDASFGDDPVSRTLAEVVDLSNATVLIGVSGQPGLFTEPIVRSLRNNTDRPVVMPLSNPTSRIEAAPSDILDWTDGEAIVATGSPFEPIERNGRTHVISQSNNVYIFPGLGLGAVAVSASKVTPEMLMTAAKAVFASGTGDVEHGVLPPLSAVPELSKRIAAAVARTARDQGLTADVSDDDIDRAIADRYWDPVYPKIVGS